MTNYGTRRKVRSTQNQGPRKVCGKCFDLRGTCPQCTHELRVLNGVEPHPPTTRQPRQLRAAHYKMTLAQYEAMMEEQGGACAICQFKPPTPDDLDIDHNHATGRVRGLLCSPCNQGLGMLQDSPDIIDAALEYLEQRGCYGPNTIADDMGITRSTT